MYCSGQRKRRMAMANGRLALRPERVLRTANRVVALFYIRRAV